MIFQSPASTTGAPVGKEFQGPEPKPFGPPELIRELLRSYRIAIGQLERRDYEVFSARSMAHDALMQPESRAAFRRIINEG